DRPAGTGSRHQKGKGKGVTQSTSRRGPGRRMFAAVLVIATAGFAEIGAAQDKPRPDPGKIKSVVDDLEREREAQAKQELERLRLRRVDLISRTQYARQWILGNYQFDMYSIIRKPGARDEERLADTRRRMAARGGEMSERELLEFVTDPDTRAFLERSAV